MLPSLAIALMFSAPHAGRPVARSARVELARKWVSNWETIVAKDTTAVAGASAAVKSDQAACDASSAALHKAERTGDARRSAHFLSLEHSQAELLARHTSELRHRQAALARDRFGLRRAHRALRDLES